MVRPIWMVVSLASPTCSWRGGSDGAGIKQRRRRGSRVGEPCLRKLAYEAAAWAAPARSPATTTPAPLLTAAAFTETGAQSLNLGVAQQTMSSLRTIFGAQLGVSMDVGLRDRIAAQLRLGWSREYSDTARPVTASLVGAPAVPFTVLGAAPTRDGAVVGFSAVLSSRAQLVKAKCDLENQIRGLLKNHGLVIGKASGQIFHRRAEELLGEYRLLHEAVTHCVSSPTT
jgi:hypothetical protein